MTISHRLSGRAAKDPSSPNLRHVAAVANGESRSRVSCMPKALSLAGWLDQPTRYAARAEICEAPVLKWGAELSGPSLPCLAPQQVADGGAQSAVGKRFVQQGEAAGLGFGDPGRRGI